MFPNKIHGIIFDLDNTLVSSNLDFNEIRFSIGCPDGHDILSYIDKLPDTQKHIAHQKVLDFEMTDAQQATILPGTSDLLFLLNKSNMPHAIVTRNCKKAAQLKMHNNNINIPMLLTRENSKAKPSPDAINTIAKVWQKPTHSILFVGDHLYDVQTAVNAKAMSCLINYEQNLPYEHLADGVVKDLIELKFTLANDI